MVRFLTSFYNGVINAVDKYVPAKLRPVWMSPVGPKTIFFWAPICKWGLVIAGLGDLQRPAENISLNQATTLALSGVIWSRYSVIIVPKNYMLLAANLFLVMTQGFQVVRAINIRKQ